MAIPKLRAPIVLVPGLVGLDHLRLGRWTVFSYFARLPQALAASGNRVLVPRMTFAGGIVQRATELKAFLHAHVPGEPVHILGHSMAGLDSRYMISHLDMASRVLSLTTIGTPHRGTTFADWGTDRLTRVVRPMLDMLDLPHQGFLDVTTSNCRRFNEQVPDAPTVRYFSVAGKHDADWRSLEWQLSHRIVHRHEGPNDGVVSVASATYGESCEVWDADHLALVNWPTVFARLSGRWRDRTSHYAGLIRRLADEGF